MRRFSSALIRSADTGNPAGIPSRIPTRPRPCDSPAVVKRKVIDVDNNTRARLRVGLSGFRGGRERKEDSPPHRRRLRVDVRDGREGDYHEAARRDPEQQLVAGWPATLSLATRSGPMIGSRVLMRFC